MPTKVFVDTGVFIAITDKTDQFHDVAVRCLMQLQRSGQQKFHKREDYLTVKAAAVPTRLRPLT